MRLRPILERLRSEVRIARRIEIAQSAEPMVELTELPMIELIPQTEDQTLESARTIDNNSDVIRVCTFAVRSTVHIQDNNPDSLDDLRDLILSALQDVGMGGYSVIAWESGSLVALNGNVISWDDVFSMSRNQ